MMHPKTMLAFEAILVAIALCFVVPSKAEDWCIYCDPETGNKYEECLMANLARFTEFQGFKLPLNEMALFWEKEAKDKNIIGNYTDTIMKGAMIYSLASMKCDDQKIAIISNILKYCFEVVKKDVDWDFTNKYEMMAKNKTNPSVLQQPTDQTQSNKTPESIQNGNYPSPVTQNDYQYDNVYQQQGSVSAVTAYSSQQKDPWTPNPHNSRKVPWQNSYQQPTTNEGKKNDFAVSTASSYASTFYDPKQQPATMYVPNAKENQPGNTYNQAQNYQPNPNVYPIPNGGDFFSNVNNPSYTQTPVTWNNGGNNKLYRGNSGYYPENRNLNSNNWPYYQAKYPDNQFIGNNARTDALAYSYASQRNNNFYNQPYSGLSMPGSPQATFKKNDAFSYSSTGSSGASSKALSSSSTKDDESYASSFSSASSNSKLPDNNERYPLQQNVPSSKDNKTSNDTVFSQTLYNEICDAPSVKNVINEKTTKDQLKAILKYVILYSLNMCGYPKEIAQKCAVDSNNFANALPQGLPSSTQVKAICEMMKIQFLTMGLIGSNPVGQARCLGNGMKICLEELQNPSTSPESQQNLSRYPTKYANDNDDDSNPNKYAAKQQIGSFGVPNKELNNNSDQYQDDIPISYDKTNKTSKIKPNEENDQSNDDAASKTSNNSNYKGYPAAETPQIGKQGYGNQDQLSGAGASAYSNAEYDKYYYDDDDYYSLYNGDQDNNGGVSTIFPQVPSTNSPPKQPNKPNVYNIDDKSADDKVKQQSNPQQLLNYQQEKLKDNDFEKYLNKPTYLSTVLPPLQSYKSDFPQNLDSMKNTTAENSIADLKDRIEMLMKILVSSFKDGDFDYKNYSKGIAMVANITRDKHPEMPPQEVKMCTIVDALYTCIALMKANPDFIQQLQKNIKPMQEIKPKPDYQAEQATKNEQQVIQNKPLNQPTRQQLASPQNQEILNDQWRNGYNANQNSRSQIQDTYAPQLKPTYMNSVPQIKTENIPKNKAQDNDWYGNDQQQPIVPPQQPIVPPQQPIFPQQQPIFPPQQAIVPPQQAIVPPQQAIVQPQQPIFSPQLTIVPPQQPIFPPQQFIAPPQQTVVPPQQPIFPPQQFIAPPQQPRIQEQPQQGIFPQKPMFQQPPIIASNGYNLQNNPSYQIGFQKEPVKNLNGIQNGNQFEWSNPQSNVNLLGVRQSGNQQFSDARIPNFGQDRNQGTYNLQDRGFNTQAENSNQRGLNILGNQGGGGAGQTGNYPRDSLSQNNFPVPGNQWH